MNFLDYYFIEKKKPSLNIFPKKKFKQATFFNSKKYDKGTHATFDFVGESLNTKVEFEKYSFPDAGYFSYEFNLEDNIYSVNFSNFKKDFNGTDIYEFSFSVYPKGRFDLNTFDLTKNSTHPFKVMGAVAYILNEFIKENKPYAFYFSAKEPSRIRLYDRFAKMIDEQTDYKFDDELNDIVIKTVGQSKEKYYTFSKK